MKKFIALALMSNAVLAQDISIPVNEKTSALIGTGYSSENQANNGQCLDGEVVYVGKQDANFNLDTTVRQEALEKSLGMEAGFRVRTGVTTYSGSAKFLKASKSNSHSITLNYSADYSFKQRLLSNPKLNTIGEKFRDNPDRFKKTCGDNFIYKQTLGAKLFYTLKINFDSKEARDFFEAKVKMSSSMNSAYAGLRNAKNHFSSKTKVTFTAYQLGGDISKLTSLISDVENTDTNKNSAYAFVECTLGSLEKCENVMKAAINYATDTRKGFPSQLSPDSTDTAQGPAVLENFAKDYKHIGEYIEFSPELTFTVKTARKKLSKLFEDVFAQQNTAYQLVNEGIVRLSPAQKESLQKVESHLYEQMQFLAEGIEYCYDKPGECPEVFNQLKTEVKLYDENIFTVKRESFAQHCDFSLSPFSSEALRHSINVLVKKAKDIDPDFFAPGSEGQQIDTCSHAETVLMKQEALDLSGLDISDITPISSLTNLRNLNLSFNKIVDISELKNLIHLRKLNLNNNKISSIASLSGLRGLEEIHLVNNSIQDVSPIAELRMVRKLDIRNNNEKLECPYYDKKICYVIDFDKKISIVPLNNLGSENRKFPTASKLGDQVFFFGGLNLSQQALKGGLPTGGYAAGSLSGGEVLNNDLSVSSSKFCSQKGYPCHISAEHMNTLDFYQLPFEERNFIFHTATNIDTKSALIAGSLIGKESLLVKKDMENKLVFKKIEMSQSRKEHTATKLNNGDILLTGGWAYYGKYSFPNDEQSSAYFELISMIPAGAQASAEVFKSKEESFVAVKPLNIPRAGHTATLLNDGRVLIIGGFNLQGKSLNSMEIYNPSTGQFELLSSKLSIGRGHHKAEMLNDGKILVIGGYTGIEVLEDNKEPSEVLDPMKKNDPDDSFKYPATAVVEVIDPSTMKVTTLEHRLNHERGDHAVIKLSNGMLLMAGGAKSYKLKNKMRGTCIDCLDSIEVFDPESGTFTLLKDVMTAPSMGLTVTALDDERVVVSGGDVNAIITIAK